MVKHLKKHACYSKVDAKSSKPRIYRQKRDLESPDRCKDLGSFHRQLRKFVTQVYIHPWPKIVWHLESSISTSSFATLKQSSSLWLFIVIWLYSNLGPGIIDGLPRSTFLAPNLVAQSIPFFFSIGIYLPLSLTALNNFRPAKICTEVSDDLKNSLFYSLIWNRTVKIRLFTYDTPLVWNKLRDDTFFT